MTYVQRLRNLTAGGPALCVGLDPHPEILDAWGERDTPAGLRSWVAKITLALVSGGVTVVKPQVALFERHGVHGMSALHTLLGGLREAGCVVIGDAKRGDIGSTMRGYAQAWLTPGADFEVDALTVVAYQGLGSLLPALESARDHDKGVFVLAATSNPEAWQTQAAVRIDGLSVASGVVHEVSSWVRDYSPHENLHVGIVVGGTVDQVALGLDLSQHPYMPILAPGYGAQGAPLTQVKHHFAHSQHVLAVSARALLSGGPESFEQRYIHGCSEVTGP
jgi:orotidine-5'-phosphate decarboxylase